MNLESLRPYVALINSITKGVILVPLAVWAVWEVLLAVLRWKLGPEVRFISQMGRHLASTGLAALSYFSCGLAAHIYLNWHRPTWEGNTAVALGLFWWLTGFAYLVADLLDPAHVYWPLWAQWVRHSSTAGLLGAILALVCFPQAAEWLPGVGLFRR